MSDEATLSYLKSIDDRTARIEDKMDAQGDRIASLEQTRAKQRGIMTAGGAAVTLFSGIAAWFGGHQ